MPTASRWAYFVASILLLVASNSLAEPLSIEAQSDSSAKETAVIPMMSEQNAIRQRPDVAHSESAQIHEHDSGPHDSDDEPMVYETPRDYATLARQERERMIAEGADPDSVIFQSELCNHVPAREGESDADYAKRYAETMNAMIRRGVSILNDQCTADVQASGFGTADGRFFDLGPGTGVTKGEFREFHQWFDSLPESGQTYEVPEKWKRFEKPGSLSDHAG